MFISNILKQNRANKELQDRLKQNIESTATLLRAVDNDNQNTEAIENYEEVNKIKKEDRKKLISFTYPEKTVKSADIDHHRRVHEAEVTFRQELTQWNDRLFTANQADRASRPIEAQEEGAQAVAAGSRVRIADCKPTFIKPAETVVKVGDTHFEIKLERELNPETRTYEWKRQDMEILERPEPNDVSMEESCITFENKEKSKIDWESTLKNIKEYGEQLGYSKKHYLRCLLRIMGQNNDDLFLTYKEEEDPEKIANSLLAKYIGVNKKKLFENKLKTLTRVRGQSIRDVMTQADILADRILQKCKDPQEKAFRKHQILLDALKSFCSEENAKELIQALKGSSLSGERADIGELIDTIEIAERVNENSKPTRDMIFMNDKTSEKCEIFTLNTEKDKIAARASDGARALEDTIQKTKELSLRGREDRKRQSSQERFKKDQNQRGRDENNRGRSREYGDRRSETSNQRSQSRESTNRGYRNDRDWSRNRSNPRERLRETNSKDRSWNDRNRDNRSERNFSRERRNSRERGYSRERENSRNWNRDDRRDSNRWNNGATNFKTESYKTNNQHSDRNRGRDNSYNRGEQSRANNYRGRDDSRNSQRNRDDSRNRQWSRDVSQSRQEDGNYSRYRQGGRDESRNRQGGRDGARYRSQSRDSNKRSVPMHKRNLEGVEFPPHTQMDLTVRFCVKCHNSLEQHYPWDCKLYRYWSNTPCEICYNGQHRSKECRKNPNRVDAFTVMLEHVQIPNTEKPNQANPSFSPF